MKTNLDSLPFPTQNPLFLLLESNYSTKNLSQLFKEYSTNLNSITNISPIPERYIFIPGSNILLFPYAGDKGALRAVYLEYDENTVLIKEEFLGIIEPINSNIDKNDLFVRDITPKTSQNPIIEKLNEKTPTTKDDNPRKIFQQRRILIRPGAKSISVFLHLLSKKLPDIEERILLHSYDFKTESSEDFYTYNKWDDLVSISFSEFYLLSHEEIIPFINQEMSIFYSLIKSRTFEKAFNEGDLKSKFTQAFSRIYINSNILNLAQRVDFDTAFQLFNLAIKFSRYGYSDNDKNQNNNSIDEYYLSLDSKNS